jgi:hypothetical protein
MKRAYERLRRVALLVCAVSLLTGARAFAAPATAPVDRPTRDIAIVLNGETLPTDTPPQVIEGRILIPLRTIFDALGIPLVRSGRTITLHVPPGDVVVTIGSAAATLNDKPVDLGARVVEVDGTTYVPIKLLKIALGANASYDAHGARVEILSALIGRATANEEARADGGTTVNGIAQAIDTNSAPPSITVTQGSDQTRTISVNSSAVIYVEDVTVHSQVKALLGDIHVGDQVAIVLSKSGTVVEIHDFYSSDNGTISAVSPIAIVLHDGKVVQPARSTDVLLNGTLAHLTDLAVGDVVTVRRNPLTKEIRQIIASRTVVAAATAVPASGNVKITAFAFSATRPLRAGERFDVTMEGTPGGHAAFDIGDYLTAIEMHEDSPGMYHGQFTIPDRFNINQVPVYGHLNVGGVDAPRADALGTLSAATTPPQITEVAPSPGQTVDNPRPNIYATYLAPAQISINPSSVTLNVNGHDVTSSATRTPGFITYTPGIDYPDGPIVVIVKVSDAAGNTATRTWQFVIRTH